MFSVHAKVVNDASQPVNIQNAVEELEKEAKAGRLEFNISGENFSILYPTSIDWELSIIRYSVFSSLRCQTASNNLQNT